MRFDPQQAELYNYDEFTPGKFDRCWRYADSPALGRPVPDYPLWHLDREAPTTLHAELARRRITVVEFGSYSCPMSRLACDGMEEIADNYAEDGVGALFIYTNEAHPSDNMPVHRSWRDKLKMARRLREVTNPLRPILVDALDGACHRGFGAMPNMSWMLSARAEPLFKAEWTSPAHLERALRYQLELQRGLEEYDAVLLHSCEMVAGVRVDIREHDCIMEENGEQALMDFRKSFGEWPERILWPSRMSQAGARE
jgi:hypothetical protein